MKHLEAIKAGTVTRSNVIGIRKALNANARREARLSVSCTSPKLTGTEVAAIELALSRYAPRVTDQLHDKGLSLLRSRRYAKRLEPVADIIATLESIHLVAFEWIDELHSVPIYRAKAPAGTFLFRTVAWQSGGNGPEVLGVSRRAH